MVNSKLSRVVCFSMFAMLSVTIFAPDRAFGCDLCSIYNAEDSEIPKAGTFQLGVAEQWTEYAKIQDGGKKIANEGHQQYESSITQMFLGYGISEAVGLQLTLPYISRRFKRINDGEVDKGTEAGIGDLNLIAKANVWSSEGEGYFTSFQLFGGLKFATGSSDRLKEELEEHGHHEKRDATRTKHEPGEEEPMIMGAIHGHDLALGTGSYDFPIGATFHSKIDSFFLRGAVQYNFRTGGDHSYRYANDLMWSAGPGYYIHEGDASALSTRVVLSGEYKGKDKGLHGAIQDDTGVNALFIGPELSYGTKSGFGAELGWDAPVNIENTGTQAVATTRLRMALSYRF